jgi:integrase
MRGSITKRGRNSWRLKFDLPDAGGKRATRYTTIKGNRRAAEAKLAELLNDVAKDSYVEPSKTTVADFVAARIDFWQASGAISARTAENYRGLLKNQIAPHLGGYPLQKLRAAATEDWFTALQAAGLSTRTCRHAQRVLSKAMKDAVRLGLVVKSVLAAPPRIIEPEMVIVRDVPSFIEQIRGQPMFVHAMIGLLAGLRIGEVLALRWNRVDLERKVLQVREAIVETGKDGIVIGPPKTKAGRRDVSMPDALVEVLRAFRKQQLELRIKLGAGRLAEDTLLFAGPNGELPSQKAHSNRWAATADRIGHPEITFHALRHTHASQLIDANVDVVTISRRLGHAKPDITLRTYAHLFRQDDSKAAAAINQALAR